jgi:hypothetical protein
MFSRKTRFNGRLFFSYGGGYFRNGRTTLHRYKYEKKYGSLLPYFHLHHKNGDRLDNRLENLEALTPREHAAVHKTMRRRMTHENQLTLEI